MLIYLPQWSVLSEGHCSQFFYPYIRNTGEVISQLWLYTIDREIFVTCLGGENQTRKIIAHITYNVHSWPATVGAKKSSCSVSITLAYSTGQRKVKRVPRNLRVYYAGTLLFYAECGDSLHV